MKGGVRKRGKKWYYYFDAASIDGKRKKIERVGGLTKKEAETALRKAINEYENCGTVKIESSISVADYFNFWYDDYVKINCKHNTQVGYANTIKNHIIPKLGIYKLKSLTPAILQNFLNDKFKEGYSKDTLIGYKGLLTGALRRAVHPYEYIKENPMQYVTIPRYDSSKIDDTVKTISLDDYYKILRKFPNGHKLNIPIQIAFHTGLRASEVCGLTWNNIDFENKTINIEKILIYNKSESLFLQSPKTKSSIRKIAMGDILINLLKNHKEWQNNNKIKYGEFYLNDNNIDYGTYINSKEYGFVCTGENGEIVNTAMFRHLSHVVNKQLNISFNFHSLRHTHATLLLESGANIKDIQVRLGHSKLSTTMDTYSHVTKKMSYESINLFENALK